MRYQYFRDFDAFANAVRDIDSVMLLQNPVRLIWSISHLDLSGIYIQMVREGGGNIIEGKSRSDGYILFIPLNHAGAYAANGTALNNNSVLILEPGSDFCIRCKTEHDWCSVFVPIHKLAGGGKLVGSSSGSEKIRCRVSRPNCQLVEQFRALMRQLLTAAANCSEFESSSAATRTAEELRQVTSLVIGQRQAGNPHQEGRPKLRREVIIRRSKELLKKHNGEPFVVEELAAAVEVCERTLRTAFNEYFGMGPARYFQLRQLNLVHRALRAADSETVTVSDVLLQYGVWEFGRFASRYSRLFGELPSQTLQTKVGSVIKSFQRQNPLSSSSLFPLPSSL